MSANGGSLIEVRDVSRRFGKKLVLDGVSLSVPGGHVHALLGRNGAGKTTLLRILTGLVAPNEGSVIVGGANVTRDPNSVRDVIGLVPSGDRTFYLRLNGLENLLFFARLRGHSRRAARTRALQALEAVGLQESARQRVGTYSHGMQKRLSFARALLDEPAVLLVDEATHDLDPEWAAEVRRLVRQTAERGAAVVWATQRVDEIRGFADGLTLLDGGHVRFDGTVGGLLERVPPTRYVLGVANGAARDGAPLPALSSAVGILDNRGANGELVLTLRSGAVLGDALAEILRSGVTLVSCRQETPEVEDAFLKLLEDDE
ncbi:MAG TPA: ABC transporter ATP-binding protein [Gaiellaceae bacterium]|nr:ABC transporter ATP-binding protein [Gaiellaceae bacterium]